jgi:hypothetical protein
MARSESQTMPLPLTTRAGVWLHALSEMDLHGLPNRAVALATAASMKPVWNKLEKYPGNIAEQFMAMAMRVELFIPLPEVGPRAHPHEVREHVRRLKAAFARARREVNWLLARIDDVETHRNLGRLLGCLERTPPIPLKPRLNRETPTIELLSKEVQQLTGRPHDAFVAVTAAIVLGVDVDMKRVQAIRRKAKKTSENREPI